MRTPRDDDAVVQIVSFSLIAAALIIFLAVFNATWVPVWVVNLEAGHADELREAVTTWADTAEDLVGRDAVGRSFTRVLPLGTEGLPVLGSGASGGAVTVESDVTLEVYDDSGASPDHTASGSLAATTDPVRFPQQTFRYALGAFEIDQTEGAWADLRNLLDAERTSGGGLSVRVQTVTITGGPQSSATNTELSVSGTLADADEATGGASTYLRLRVTGVEAPAWRAAVDRILGQASLAKDADGVGCTTTAEDYCFDSATNTASTMDLYLRNIDSGWTVTTGTVDAEVRA